MLCYTQDGGSPAGITDTMLTVNLVDVLDPPPAFNLRAYSVEVSEGTYSDVSTHVAIQKVGVIHCHYLCRSGYWAEWKQSILCIQLLR